MTNLLGPLLTIGGILLIIMSACMTIGDARHWRREPTAENGGALIIDVGLIFVGIGVFCVGFFFFS